METILKSMSGNVTKVHQYGSWTMQTFHDMLLSGVAVLIIKELGLNTMDLV